MQLVYSCGLMKLSMVNVCGVLFAGSPFTIRITAAADASKVQVSGPGIKPGILAMYQSIFTVDTRGAGPGQLSVRMRGRKGKLLSCLIACL